MAFGFGGPGSLASPGASPPHPRPRDPRHPRLVTSSGLRAHFLGKAPAWLKELLSRVVEFSAGGEAQ